MFTILAVEEAASPHGPDAVHHSSAAAGDIAHQHHRIGYVGAGRSSAVHRMAHCGRGGRRRTAGVAVRSLDLRIRLAGRSLIHRHNLPAAEAVRRIGCDHRCRRIQLGYGPRALGLRSLPARIRLAGVGVGRAEAGRIGLVGGRSSCAGRECCHVRLRRVGRMLAVRCLSRYRLGRSRGCCSRSRRHQKACCAVCCQRSAVECCVLLFGKLTEPPPKTPPSRPPRPPPPLLGP